MARKKNTKVPSKKYVYDDGDGLFCNGSSSSSSSESDDVDEQNSASSSMVASPVLVYDQIFSAEKELIFSFYEKLVKFHQSSGLSLVFNFQETKVDLYLLYKNVTQMGGFHQVSKEGKWREVAYALNLKMQVSLLPGQVQKLYENLLLQYEQMHYYRTPAGKGKDVVLDMDQESLDYGYCLKCSLGKRKASENSSHDDQVRERNLDIINSASTTGHDTSEQKMNVQIHFDDKDIKDLHLPIKPRTAYQLFVKMECDRLRKLHEESSSSSSSSSISYRNMATEAWKNLSNNERLPYIEASQKDKERFNRDMVVYEQNWNQKIAKKQKLLNNPSTSLLNFNTALPPDDGYYVTLEEDADSSTEHFCVLNESVVETTIQILKSSRPNDPMFHINWDGCCCGSPNSLV